MVSNDGEIVANRDPCVILFAVQDEGLKRLLMSWYYAGYYTGLYEGQQQERQQQQQQHQHQTQEPGQRG